MCEIIKDLNFFQFSYQQCLLTHLRLSRMFSRRSAASFTESVGVLCSGAAPSVLKQCSDRAQNLSVICRNLTDVFTNSIGISTNHNDILSPLRATDDYLMRRGEL